MHAFKLQMFVSHVLALGKKSWLVRLSTALQGKVHILALLRLDNGWPRNGFIDTSCLKLNMNVKEYQDRSYLTRINCHECMAAKLLQNESRNFWSQVKKKWNKIFCNKYYWSHSFSQKYDDLYKCVLQKYLTLMNW